MKGNLNINNTALWVELPGYKLAVRYPGEFLPKGLFFKTHGNEKANFLFTEAPGRSV